MRYSVYKEPGNFRDFGLCEPGNFRGFRLAEPGNFPDRAGNFRGVFVY